MFNGHKGDGDPKGELPSDNGKGDSENGEVDRIAGKGQRLALKGESLGEEEPNFFVSSISILGSAFPTNTPKKKKKKQFPSLNKLCRYDRKEQGNKKNISEMAGFQNDENP